MSKYDFSGYATKNNLKCSDGRTIRRDAFKDNHGQTVPLVWQHVHSDPTNVLGHALLENREDGVYAYCKFNDTESGKNAKTLVQHGDITALSIYANQLKQKGSDVLHGAIREVSLVLAGANPGALIDNLSIAHADGSYTDSEEEAVIYTGLNFSNKEIEHSIDEDGQEEGEDEANEEEDKEMAHADEDNRTIADVFNTLNEEQKNVVYAMIAQALDGDDDEGEEDEDINHSDEGGTNMKKNVFDNNEEVQTNQVLSHSELNEIVADAQKCGSFKAAVMAHAEKYGIENIEVLFPEARTVGEDPEWLKREDDWVAGVLAGVHKSPFSRIKTVTMDMDFEEARAKGYIKGTEKKEVYIKAAKRVTTPTTFYVKQKLDRDDIIDVTEYNAVEMVKKELRILLNEELARAILIGDGREADDADKINESNIRPIWKDEDLYSIKERLSSDTDFKAMVKEISLSRKRYKGSGNAVFYTTPDVHANMLWIEDKNERRIYESDATLCAALGVKAIVEVPHFDGLVRTTSDGKQMKLVGIKVNLKDYNIGTDKGGEISSFEDFDIDYNQYKYLMEGRCSGALKKVRSAQIYETLVGGEQPAQG